MRALTGSQGSRRGRRGSAGLFGGQLVVEGLLLEDQADVAADPAGVLDDVVAGHSGPSGCRSGQGAQHLDRGRLPGPVGPEKSGRSSPCATSKLTDFTAVRSP